MAAPVRRGHGSFGLCVRAGIFGVFVGCGGDGNRLKGKSCSGVIRMFLQQRWTVVVTGVLLLGLYCHWSHAQERVTVQVGPDGPVIMRDGVAQPMPAGVVIEGAGPPAGGPGGPSAGPGPGSGGPSKPGEGPKPDEGREAGYRAESGEEGRRQGREEGRRRAETQGRRRLDEAPDRPPRAP